jgi:regulator of sigma E protease
MDLLQSLLSNLWAVFLVVFFFGGSIFVHELGHFLAARRRGVVVERFSIGMGPPIFKWKGKDGVEYWISWLPLGGYVKLPQLADLGAIEGNTSVDYTKLPPPSYSTKVLVFVAGAVFNMVFAFLLACILWVIGFPKGEDIMTTQIGYVMPTMELPDQSKQQGPAAKAGVKPGDVILEIDGRQMRDWASVHQTLALGAGRTSDGTRVVHLKLQRGSEVLNVTVNPILAGEEKMRKIGVLPAHRLVVEKTTPGSVAENVGFKPGDRIEALDGETIHSFTHFASYLDAHAAAPVKLRVRRGETPVELTVPPQPDLKPLLTSVEFAYDVRLVYDDPIVQLSSIFEGTFKSLASLANPRSDIGLSKMSGPIGIFGQFWDAATSSYPLRVVMWFTMLINVSLAVFNLLPIPVLDGGHILFATIGKLRGRALPTDFIHAAQSVFIVLLFSMVIYVSFHDVRRRIRTDRPATAPTENAPAAPPAPAVAPETERAKP